MRYGYFIMHRGSMSLSVLISVSWTNYLLLHSNLPERGGYSFYKTPQHGRITRFRPNAIPLDRPGHYLYLRDDQSGQYWSVSWQPVGIPLDQAAYRCRHGLSYSVFSCAQA